MDKLAYFGGSPTLDSNAGRFSWPHIDDDVIHNVLRQLNDTISIYDRSSVFEEFEMSFSKYHGLEFSVLFNSGTSALHAAYDGMRLKPGDEVICGGYNFHAAISPAMQYGITPVFADVDKFGNCTIDEIVRLKTPRTRCVLVTHMWGIPCSDINEISAFCRDQEVYLLEDCSHAHGAQIDGKLVGTYGDIAAWSLQGQKVISGGEGGILSTNNEELYYNALIFGHYNKRPKNEIPNQWALKGYSVTGKGLKLRAHPIAIAIALTQFRLVDEIISIKANFAQKMQESFSCFDFVDTNVPENCVPSWYTFPIRFIPESAGINREHFVELLHSEGLIEYDIPGSTGDITAYPLFTAPHKVLPHLDWSSYRTPVPDHAGVSRLTSSLIKLPVWGRHSDAQVVHAYIRGFKKVAEALKHTSGLAQRMRAAR